MSLRELYQEMIIDHGKHPRNFGKLTDANHCHTGHNPICGDKLKLYVLEKNNKVEDIRFEGNGCAISVASASLMTEEIKGKSKDEAVELFHQFQTLVTVQQKDTQDLGKLSVFAGVREFPARVKCAILAWHTLKAALQNDTHVVSTE